MELTALSVKPGVGRSADVATHSHDICVTQSSGPLDITPPTSNEGSNQGKPLKFKIFLVLQLFMDTAVITHDNSGRRATYNVIFYCQSSSLLIFCVILLGLNYSECPIVAAPPMATGRKLNCKPFIRSPKRYTVLVRLY